MTKRLLTKTNTGISVPKWGERLLNNKPICIIEESIVDPINREVISYTRNLGYTKIMVSILFFYFKITEYKNTEVIQTTCVICAAIMKRTMHHWHCDRLLRNNEDLGV